MNSTDQADRPRDMYRRMKRTVKLVLLFAVLVSFSTSSIVTLMDWRTNPGAVFQSETGTQWRAVWDTWISWFAPLSALSFVVGLLLFAAWISWRHRQDVAR